MWKLKKAYTSSNTSISAQEQSWNIRIYFDVQNKSTIFNEKIEFNLFAIISFHGFF